MPIQLSRLFTFCFLLYSLFFTACQQPEPASDPTDTEARIEDLIRQMTLEEKVSMIHANSSFTSAGVERLGIPELVTSDGPHGVRREHGRDWAPDENVLDSSTYLPTGTALAATWNEALGYQYGAVLGSEANFRGKDVILGPGLNIIRTPLNGRNFEYLTEDPYLNARMGIGYTKGVQEQDVAACPKHYIANCLEYEREMVNVEMSVRALREIYLPAYKAVVEEADALTVMAAYNKFRGTYCAHSAYLLDTLLRKEFGFEGLVMSDWSAVKSTMGAVNVGMDLEMGSELDMGKDLNSLTAEDYGNFYLGDTVVTLVKNGVVSESVIDDKVRRILRVMFRIGKFGERTPGAYNTPEHQTVARQVAEEAIVLLKNDGVLPLQQETIKTLAVVGANAVHKHSNAGGSSQVKAFYEVTPLEGLQKLLGEDVAVNYAPGYAIKKDGSADPALIREAVANVSQADAAVFVGGWIHGYTDAWDDNAYDAENVDKPDMHLPFGQDELIRAVLQANPNTIIVLFGGGPTDMRTWQADAKGIIQAWYPGMEGGNALAAILLGEVNPSGKLPMTFPKKLEDSPAHSLATFPIENLLIEHSEDIFVGYRYFDTYEVEPAFAFGHGLSYTTFEYGDLAIEKNNDVVTVSLTLTNSGDQSGAEVVQVYVRDEESALPRPDKELKAFRKIRLEPGASQTVQIDLNKDAFQYYDDRQQTWVLEPGAFTLLVGSSSRDIRLEGQVEWK